MSVVILDKEMLDPWTMLAEFQARRFENRTDYGATSVFVGTMRDFNEGDTVQAMVLEHYPGMTESSLERIIVESKKKWELLECLIVHRVGNIQPAEPIMLVAAWSSHRREAFEANRYLVEELKHRVPFWKQETLKSGESRWVDKNTPG